MKKILIVLVILLALITIAAPKVIGNKVDQQLTSFVTKINQSPGYKATIKQIENNWFTTAAVINVSFDLSDYQQLKEQVSQDSFNFDVSYHAEHGPVLFQQSTLAWLAWSASIAGDDIRHHLTLNDNKPLYMLQAKMHLFGDYSYQDTIPAFTANIEKNNGKITFSGYQGHGQYKNNQLTYQSTSNNLAINSDINKLTIANLSINMMVDSPLEQMFTTSLYDSDTKFNIGTIKFIDTTTNKNVSLNDFYVTAFSKIDESHANTDITVTYGVKEVNTPEFKAQDIALEIEFNNINNQFINAYQDMLKTSSSASQEDIAAFFQENAVLFFASKPELNIKSLRATLPSGKFSSNINTSLVNIERMPEPIADPAFWLAHLLVDGNITGDKAVVEFLAKEIMKVQLKKNPKAADMSDAQITEIANNQIAQMIEPIVQQGFLIATENTYTMDFSLKNKALTVNGKPIPLPM